jgi:hypothetical protein
VSDQKQIQEYMRKGIAAAKAKDRDTARQFFEKVIEMDKNNEKA